MEYHGWKGARPGVSRVLRRGLALAERNGRSAVVGIDEYLVSKVFFFGMARYMSAISRHLYVTESVPQVSSKAYGKVGNA